MIRIAPLLLALSACTAAPPVEEPATPPPSRGFEGACDASAVRDYIGQRVTPELGQRLLALSGARVLRVGATDGAMTMDYSADRLNVFHDAGMIIERITCG